MDRDDVRVVECTGCAGFVLEAIKLLLVQHGGERQYLECYAPTYRNLLGFVHDPHATTANFTNDTEVTEYSCNLMGRLSWLGGQGASNRMSEVRDGLQRGEQHFQLLPLLGT